MTFPPAAELLSLRYRAALSNYLLIPFEHLSPVQRERLGSLRQDPGFYGILEPRRAGHGMRTANQDTAALFHSLQQAGRPPDEAQGGGAEPLLRLVLDGVLEIEWEGHFLSGPGAHRALGTRPRELSGETIGHLSLAALRYADALEGLETLALADRLYRFNSLPASPEWLRLLPTHEAVTRFLRTDPSGVVAASLEQAGFSSSQDDGWHSWQRPGSAGHPGYKLYLSPSPRALPDIVQQLAALVEDMPGVNGLKVGRGLHGILRPDKCVIYLDDWESLERLSDRLRTAVRDVRGHGVPFTALLTADGSLSWGVDPVEAPGWRGWMGGESWRSWVVSRLAASLVMAHAEGSRGDSAIRFALDRLALEGVDAGSWSPTASFEGYAPH